HSDVLRDGLWDPQGKAIAPLLHLGFHRSLRYLRIYKEDTQAVPGRQAVRCSRMKRYVVTRLLFLVLMLLGLMCITFVISHVAPGDPARLAAGPDANASMVETMRAKYGLDRPLPVQFVRYARGLATGDLGESIRSRNPVLDDLVRYFPNTFELVTLALLLAVAVGVPLGMLSAVHQNRAIDHVARMLSVSGVALPAFWLGLMLQ